MDRCGRSGDAATTRPRDSLKQPQPAEGEKAKVFVTGICRQDDDITGIDNRHDKPDRFSGFHGGIRSARGACWERSIGGQTDARFALLHSHGTTRL